jgi:hypothetical protein
VFPQLVQHGLNLLAIRTLVVRILNEGDGGVARTADGGIIQWNLHARGSQADGDVGLDTKGGYVGGASFGGTALPDTIQYLASHRLKRLSGIYALEVDPQRLLRRVLG